MSNLDESPESVEKSEIERLRLEAQIKELKQIISLLKNRLNSLENALNVTKWHPFKSGTGDWAFSCLLYTSPSPRDS